MGVEELQRLAILRLGVIDERAPLSGVAQADQILFDGDAGKVRSRRNRPRTCGDLSNPLPPVVVGASRFAQADVLRLVHPFLAGLRQSPQRFRRTDRGGVGGQENLRIVEAVEAPHLGEEDGKRAHADIVEMGGGVLDRLFRKLPQLRGARQELVGEDQALRREEDGQRLVCGIAVEAVERVEVIAHKRRGLPVVAVEEVVHQLLRRKFRIPHPLGEQPALQFREVAVAPLVCALLEEELDVVLLEEPDVVLEREHVREWHRVAVEVGGVVPDEKLVGLPAPPLDVLDELPVLVEGALVDREGEVAFDRAQADDHVVAQPRDLRRLARILVGERLNHLVGELLFHRLGDRVDEPDHRAGVGLLLLVDLLAFRAGAVVVPVVLADAEVLGGRVFPDVVQHPFRDDAQDIRIGQAELAGMPQALAVDLAEVLRVRVEELIRAQQPREGVAVPEAVPEPEGASAVLRLQVHRVSVDAVARGKVAVSRFPVIVPERLAHGDGGNLRVVQIVRHGDGLALRNDAMPRGVPAASGEAVEYLVATVERAAHRSSQHQQMRRTRLEPKSVQAELFPVGIPLEQCAGVPRVAQEDRAGRQLALVVGDGQRDAGRFRKEALEFLRRVFLRFGGVGGIDDGVGGLLASLGERQFSCGRAQRGSQAKSHHRHSSHSCPPLA